MDLRARQKDRVRAYSLGMKQRLTIAVALLHDPALLVLDEPANGLDPAGIVEIRRLLRRLAGAGRTVFMSSHVLAHVQQTCDRLAIIAAGRLVKVAPVSELVRSAGEFELRVEDPVAALAVIRAQPWGAAARDVGRLQLLAIKLTALVIVGPCLVASFALLTGAAAYVVHAAWQAGSPSGAAWGPPAAPPPPR